MGKLKHRQATPKRPAEPVDSTTIPSFEPLPPPRRNKLLLAVASGLVIAWIAFLTALVLWS
jgi:hypothetical protein